MIKLGIVMDSFLTIDIKKDTSIILLKAARDLGCQLYYMELEDLFQWNCQAMAYMSIFELNDSIKPFKFLVKQEYPLHHLDVILMRKNPPVNSEFIYATYLLEQAEQHGTLVINKPKSLRDCNEKFFATHFPQCMSSVVVSNNMKILIDFVCRFHEVILKPMDGMGGEAIFYVRADDVNLKVILETLTQNGTKTIMGQKFIPEIVNGDKRILIIDGEVVPYSLARIPAAGQIRGNLASGAIYKGQLLSDRDKWIARQVGDELKRRGLFFVGIDVIGDFLTEINVTSPTCLQEIEREFNVNIAVPCMEKILKTS